jgi:hypothetical protein
VQLELLVILVCGDDVALVVVVVVVVHVVERISDDNIERDAIATVAAHIELEWLFIIVCVVVEVIERSCD